MHEKWHNFSFDPSSHDIEKFIRDVKMTDNQLGHRNDSILNLIKACMPTEIHGTIYSITDLADLIKIVKDIYAMKPGTTKTTATTSTTQFSTMQSKIATQCSFNLASAPLPGFPNDDFYRYYDTNRFNNRRSRPYKPYITRSRGKGDYTNNYQGSSIEVIIDIKVEVDFIQIEAISYTEVIEDCFESLIEVQI